jgi:hypothetical protein
MNISAIIPTRGDVDTDPIVAHLRQYPEIDDIHIVTSDTVFSRYRAAARASHETLYTQDDDCLTDLRPLIDAYEPGVIVNALTPQHAAYYTGAITLVGFGAIFERSMIRALDTWEKDGLFLRECDRVFTALHPHKSIVQEIRHLPQATAANRMYKERDHEINLVRIKQRICRLTGIAA